MESSAGGLRLDLPPVEAARLRAQARLKARRLANEERYATNPWAFVSEVAKTLDQRGGQDSGVKWHPGGDLHDGHCAPVVAGICAPGGCENALEHLVRVWHVSDRLLVAKSRRLIVTWTFMILYYWRARYRSACLIGIASQKKGQNEDEGSAELIKRIKFVHDNLPLDLQPRPTKYDFARFRFLDNHSTIVGIAEGPNQARQYTFTDYFADEFAFWEKPAETYGALLPTLEGGGRFVGCSTAAPGFMEQLVFDRWAVGG